jgi:single-strand DNA-binding protein
MSKSLNKVLLIGHVGKDPEVRFTGSGTPVASFSLATNESWKDAEGNQQERTDWHNIIAWKKLAEICGQWLKKGSKVYIEGRIQTRDYDDKNTGTKKYITEIIASSMIMLSDNRKESGAAPAEGSALPAAPAASNDDLPF